MNDNVIQMMEDDFEKNEATSLEKMDQTGLKTVAEIARMIVSQEAKLADLEQRTKDAKKELLQLTDNELPNMLAEIGLKQNDTREKDRKLLSNKLTVRQF